MKKFLSILLVLSAMMSMFIVPAFADGENFTMTLTAPETVNAGESITVTAEAKNVSAYGGLISVDFYLSYPSDIAEFTSVSFGTEMAADWVVDANAKDGIVRVFAVDNSCAAAVETLTVTASFTVSADAEDAAALAFTLTNAEGSASNGAYVVGTDASCSASVVAAQPEPDVKNGIYEENGVLYYYENDVKTAAGGIEIDGKIYFVRSGGKVATGKYMITNSKGNGLLADGWYMFRADGALMDNEITTEWESGKMIYIKDGKPLAAGGVEIDGIKHYIRSGCNPATGLYWVNAKKGNGLFEDGFYMFDDDGKLTTNKFAIWNTTGEVYIRDGRPYAAGVVEVDGDIYYIRSSCKKATGVYNVPENKTNGLITAGVHTFGDDGKLID